MCSLPWLNYACYRIYVKEGGGGEEEEQQQQQQQYIDIRLTLDAQIRTNNFKLLAYHGMC